MHNAERVEGKIKLWHSWGLKFSAALYYAFRSIIVICYDELESEHNAEMELGLCCNNDKGFENDAVNQTILA